MLFKYSSLFSKLSPAIAFSLSLVGILPWKLRLLCVPPTIFVLWKLTTGMCSLSPCAAAMDAYKLIVVVTTDVPKLHRQRLRDQGCLIECVQYIDPPPEREAYGAPYYRLNYTKLRVWEMERFDVLVYVDADALVVRNADELFDHDVGHDELAGVLDCFCEGSTNGKGGYCQFDPARRPWQGPGPAPDPYINAGVMVLEPSRRIFSDLLSAMHANGSSQFAEQDLLNLYYRGRLRVLPPVYNMMVSLLWNHLPKSGVSEAKIVHFCAAGSKPWSFQKQKKNLDHPVLASLLDKWHKVHAAATATSSYGEDTSPSNVRNSLI